MSRLSPLQKDVKSDKREILQYQAVANFDGEQPDDLAFRNGEILTIISERDDGWYKATNSAGKTGMVPSTFLQIYKEKAKSESPKEKEEKEYETKKEEPLKHEHIKIHKKEHKEEHKKTKSCTIL